MKKIALVGTAPTSRGDAPYGNPEWEIWMCGANYEVAPRFDKFFELHSMEVLKASGIQPSMYEFMKNAQDKLILGHPNPDYPNAQIYPKDKIVKKFGNYFTSSIALMLAAAIAESPTHIGLWGVDMVASDEYTYQRSCCEYYLGYAKASGIEIVLPVECPLIRTSRIYGLEYSEFSRETTARKTELNKAITAAKEAADKHQYYQAQLDLLNDIAKRWG